MGDGRDGSGENKHVASFWRRLIALVTGDSGYLLPGPPHHPQPPPPDEGQRPEWLLSDGRDARVVAEEHWNHAVDLARRELPHGMTMGHVDALKPDHFIRAWDAHFAQYTGADIWKVRDSHHVSAEFSYLSRPNAIAAVFEDRYERPDATVAGRDEAAREERRAAEAEGRRRLRLVRHDERGSGHRR